MQPSPGLANGEPLGSDWLRSMRASEPRVHEASGKPASPGILWQSAGGCRVGVGSAKRAMSEANDRRAASGTALCIFFTSLLAEAALDGVCERQGRLAAGKNMWAVLLAFLFWYG